MGQASNAGLKSYQEKQRQETLAKVKAAILYLRERGLPVNKKTVAEEAGLDYGVMKKPHVKQFLLQFQEFNEELAVCHLNNSKEALVVENDQLKAKIKQLETSLKNVQKQKKEVENQNKVLRAEKKEIYEKYQHLLGAYQKQGESKIVTF